MAEALGGRDVGPAEESYTVIDSKRNATEFSSRRGAEKRNEQNGEAEGENCSSGMHGMFEHLQSGGKKRAETESRNVVIVTIYPIDNKELA